MSETNVFHVTLYTKAYPIAFYVTESEMQYIKDRMNIARDIRLNFQVECYPDITTMQNRPDLYYTLKLEGKSIYGYSFSDRGFLGGKSETPIAEGIH